MTRDETEAAQSDDDGSQPEADTAPRRVLLDKIASAALLARLSPRVDLGARIPARSGALIAGRIKNTKSTYNTLEDLHGRMRLLQAGDIVAGVLGHRNALHGYAGVVPERVAVGDTLHILNLGGVVGRCTSFNPDVGHPFEIEVLGSILHYPAFGERTPVPAIIERSPALSDPGLPAALPPVVLVVGTSMNAGKTTVVCEIVRRFRRWGRVVVAGKCTGVSLLRDTLEMRDFGAARTLSFMDFGVVTTSAADGPPVARAMLRDLAREAPDAILLELGDGILGSYGVPEILADRGVAAAVKATILCATDPVGAWGGMHLLRERFGVAPCVISGPVTDNGGTAAAEREFGIGARNARRDGEGLAEVVAAALGIDAAAARAAPGRKAAP